MPPRKGARARRFKSAKKEPGPPGDEPAKIQPDGYEGPYCGLYMIKCAGQTYQGYWPCTRLEDETTPEGKFTGRLQVLCDSENLVW